MPQEQEELMKILTKITSYQHSLSDGRAVELEELRQKHVLSAADLDFLASHNVTFTPHKVSDFHSLDTLHMPTKEGCVFIGPSGPPLKKRTVMLKEFQPIVERFLQLLRPRKELLLHIEFTKEDGMGVSPNFVCFTLKSGLWRNRVVNIVGSASQLGWRVLQNNEVQGNHVLSFNVDCEGARLSTDVVTLLKLGCGFTEGSQIHFSAGALDELESGIE